MILLTRLNGTRFAVNPDLMERVQQSPDTTVVLVDGTTFIVTETLEQIIEAVSVYRARVVALAHTMQVAGEGLGSTARAPRLEAVAGTKGPRPSSTRRGN